MAWDDLSYNQRASAVRPTHKSHNVTWWRREAARLIDGTYKTTEVLNEVNQHHPVYAHISSVDNKLVAYTPDRVAGEADRQVRISLGRLLNKLYPCYSDETIKSKVELHEAEISPDVRFLMYEDIVDVYMTETFSKSCMAQYENERKGWTRATHPANAYKTQYIKLAVLYVENKPAARCLVIDHPEKKGRIRTYGNRTLDRWLDNNGWPLTDFQGMTFNTVRLQDGEVESLDGHYAVPYLDQNGQRAESATCSVALVDGVLTCLRGSTRQKMINLGCHIYYGSTAGNVYLKNFSTEDSRFTCPVTGTQVNKLEEATVTVWLNGEITEASQTISSLEGWVEAGHLRRTHHYTQKSLCVSVNGVWYFNSEQNLYVYGIYKLDSEFYSNEDYSLTNGIVTTVSGKAIRAVDAVVYATTEGKKYKHKTEVTKADVRLAGLDEGRKIYAAPGVKVLRTVSGAKVTMATHNVVEVWDGQIQYVKGLGKFNFVGTNRYTHKRQESEMVKALEIRGVEWLTGMSPDDAIGHTRVANLYSGSYSPGLVKYAKSIGRSYLIYNYDIRQAPLAVKVEYMQAVCRQYMYNRVESEKQNQVRKYVELLYAEASAVEYPNCVKTLEVVQGTEAQTLQGTEAQTLQGTEAQTLQGTEAQTLQGTEAQVRTLETYHVV